MMWGGGLAGSELARLDNARARCEACGRKVIEIEHAPCGSRYWIAFGCNSRLCEGCGKKYREEKAREWDCLGNLHEVVTERNRGKGQEREALKFVTLTFPNIDPDVTWPTPDAARAWFQGHTKNLRRFFRARRCTFCRHVDVRCPCPPGKKSRVRACRAPKECAQARAIERWGFRAYAATWEVTAEKSCASCSRKRGDHDANGRPRAGQTCSGWEPGAPTGRYHPHIHLLVWSRFVPARQLSKRWEEWGGGSIVDVRNIVENDGAKAVAYLLKYLAKPWPGIPADLQTIALHRCRRMTACGEFYGAPMNGGRVCGACGNTRAEHKAGEIDCPGYVDAERVGGLRARLARLSSRSTWRVTCLRCGVAVTGATAPWELGDIARPARAPPEWRTARVCHSWALPLDAEPAAMTLMTWAGQPAPDVVDSWGDTHESVQRVALEPDRSEWAAAIAPPTDEWDGVPF